MPELRHDPLQKLWVIISTERGQRPMDMKKLEEFPEHEFCPFCAGNENATPAELYAVRPEGTLPNSPGWELRVVPNKYPALRIEGELDRRGRGIYDQMNGIGAHEVIIESPDHDLHLADMSIAHLARLFSVYQRRILDLSQDRRFKYVLLFKNHGLSAGASLVHSHTQIVATPVTPRTIAIELEVARQHHQLKERCIFCDIIQQELLEGSRLVSQGDEFVVLAPYASRFPFELAIYPRQHHYDFASAPENVIQALAVTLKDILSRMRIGLENPPFNCVLHTAPNIHHEPRRSNYWDTLVYDFHWHLELFPRLTRVAGFEWGSGYYINTTAPEDAARFLREIQIGYDK
ncbi:MAG: galactose-1-phosphate uridylyltransferase [Candidatus Delongbacteria bacterium]|nr:galactose-1-phosphate uridylyltransferase [Candidatus Delongbacteria bacterium]